MASETLEQGQIGSYSKNPNQNQEHNQEEDNNDDKKKDKKYMHENRNVDYPNESTEEVFVNDNN